MAALIQSDTARLTNVWKQNHIPVLLRKGKGHRLMVKLPYDEHNYTWLKQDNRTKPEWNTKFKCWKLPQAWFNNLVSHILSHYGQLYIIQPYRAQETCAPACWNAKGHECQCTCMGENHGSQNPAGNWFTVSETFATLWHESKLACRLMTRRD